MSSITIECLATDGTYLYGFSQPVPTQFSMSKSHIIALIRSNANPASAATATWTLLNAIAAGDLLYLSNGGVIDSPRCVVDDKGVFSVISPASSKYQYSTDNAGPTGLQFTPGVNNRNETQGVMFGTWTQFNLVGYKAPWSTFESASTLFNYKDKGTGSNTLMHATINQTQSSGIYLSTMNHDSTALVQGDQSFKLNTNIAGYVSKSLGYANGNLYVFGVGFAYTPTFDLVSVSAMTTVPIMSALAFVPNNGTYTTLNTTAVFQSCDRGRYNIANLGANLVINCKDSKDNNYHFSYYDGTSIRELGTLGSIDVVEPNTMTPIGNSTSFAIFMVPDADGIDSMQLINDGTTHGNITKMAASVTIPDTFTLKAPPTPTSSSAPPSGNSGSGSGGGGGLGAGAIVGILAAVFVILGGLVVMVRRKRTQAPRASVVESQIHPQSQEGATQEVKHSATSGGTSSQGPISSTEQPSFVQHQQQAYATVNSQPLPQSYQPPQQQFVFSAHPRPTVSTVMDPSDQILQQQQQQQQQPSQTSQGWKPKPFVSPNQVPHSQESPSSTSSAANINIPPRPQF